MKKMMIMSRDYWIQKALMLSWFTIAYNFVEGVVATWFGLSEESFALFGFGVDSFIELASAILVIWRFSREAKLSESHQRNREKFSSIGIGTLFILLASVTTVFSTIQLWNRSHPLTTVPGLIVSILSLCIMVFLWRSKLQVAEKLNSSVMRSDAGCTLACIKLSGILFAGSLLYLLFPPLWWIDALSAIVLSGFIGWEGKEIIEHSWKSRDGGCSCK